MGSSIQVDEVDSALQAQHRGNQ